MNNTNGDMNFRIEHGIKPPEPHYKVCSKYPFKSMAIGDSFFVPDSIKGHIIRSAAHNFSIHHKDFRFSVRRVEGGCRVWRVFIVNK